MVEANRKSETTGRKTPVSLRVYDISSGAARTWSPILLGRRLEGVWHSGVECFGFEYFYGGGIVKMRPENVELAFGISPVKKHHLGHTEMSRAQFETHLQSIKPMFKREVYDLVNWNCNHFSDHVSRHLVEKPIPSYILDLPHEVCKTFMGKLLLNFIKMLQGGAAPVSVDDPEHPSKHLDGGEKPSRALLRRNSCPASPTSVARSQTQQPLMSARGATVASSVLAADPSIYGRSAAKENLLHRGRDRSAGPVRHAHRHKTVADVRRKRAVPGTTDVKDRPPRIELIAGAPIGDEETAILFSPKHKKLYELERDKYTKGAPPSVATSGVRSVPRVVKMQTASHNF